MYIGGICVYIEIDFIDDDDYDDGDDALPSCLLPITVSPHNPYTRVVYIFGPEKCLMRGPYPSSHGLRAPTRSPPPAFQ